jgi:DNA-binding LacI/PurR family transcriptional regulator
VGLPRDFRRRHGDGGSGPGRREPGAQGADGFIVSPSSDPQDPHDPILEMLERRIPLVLVDKRLAGCQSDLVCTNSQLGAEMLAEHLYSLGHRRIGFIGRRVCRRSRIDGTATSW